MINAPFFLFKERDSFLYVFLEEDGERKDPEAAVQLKNKEQ